jgi:hypothetical protein
MKLLSCHHLREMYRQIVLTSLDADKKRQDIHVLLRSTLCVGNDEVVDLFNFFRAGFGSHAAIVTVCDALRSVTY